MNLNDLRMFGAVVAEGSFTAAAKRLGVPKSRVSRHVAELEAHLGLRLLQRSTRKLSVTTIGAELQRHATALLEEAAAAEAAMQRARSEPSGLLRVSCPVLLAQQTLAPLLAAFGRRFPKITLQLLVTNRRVDVIEERIDVALRVRSANLEEPGLVARYFGESVMIVVAAPALAARCRKLAAPEEFAQMPTLVNSSEEAPYHWTLERDGERREVPLQPRLVCDDMQTLKQAALDGLGAVILPTLLCDAELADGRLQRLLPQWSAPLGRIHAAYPTRRGMLPAVRALLDFMTQELAPPARSAPP